MAFEVTIVGVGITSYDTEDIYQFLEGGVLAVRSADRPPLTPQKWTEYYAPHKWEQVTAEPNHPPGSPGGKT